MNVTKGIRKWRLEDLSDNQRSILDLKSLRCVIDRTSYQRTQDWKITIYVRPMFHTTGNKKIAKKLSPNSRKTYNCEFEKCFFFCQEKKNIKESILQMSADAKANNSVSECEIETAKSCLLLTPLSCFIIWYGESISCQKYVSLP